MLEILTIGNEILTKKASPVMEFTDELASFINDMFEAMRIGRGIGLAAPQVGKSDRFFVTSLEQDKPRVFINPEIILTSPEEATYEEGCLSVPGLYARLKRPASVKIQAFNERGRPFTLDAEGLLARVIQHEFDHLNGVLFVDRLPPQVRERALKRYEAKLRI
jgi:peptide deformylase